MLRAMQVGYGYWGANVSRKLMQSNKFDFVCLAETDEDKKNKFKQNYPSVDVVDDYEDGLNKDIDAVLICTQTEYSFDIAMKAMEMGKHVFTEKPLAKNMEKAQKMVDKSKEMDVILHCDHLMVYNPVINYIKQMIDSGEMGEIQYIDIIRANLGPIRKDINALLDLAVHDIAVADYWLGGISPDYINAYGTKTVGDQDTITYLTMKQGKTLININSSWASPVKVRRTTIAGDKKMCVFDDLKTDKLTIYDKGIDVKQGEEYGDYEYRVRMGDILIPHIEDQDSLLNSINHFATCIENHTDSISGPDQSLRVMSILDYCTNNLR